MQMHRRAKLGLAGRYELVRRIEGGMTQRAAAAAFCVSLATANRWFRRWREASEQERRSPACLNDRSSRPRTARGCCLWPSRTASARCARAPVGGRG